MRLRKLAMAIGASAVLFSSQGFALGLGEITLNSALNQPLDAQIKLLQVRDLSEEEVIVKLASREAFENANVERLFFLTGLKFEVVLDDPANPHVRVTSQENVREPYLNFLIESQWPTGRMLREYTVLMDLPTFSEKNQKVVSAPSQQAAEPARPAPAPAVKPRPAVKAAEPAPAARTERSYPQTDGTYAVSAGDTLWEIALQARPDRSYSVQQTMLAIQRLNPDAFINNNINLLKKGQVLRLPGADEIASLNTRQAINEVAYQNNQWGGGAALEASRRSGAVAEDGSAREGRVQLSAGGASQEASSGRSSGRSQALENELAIAQEQLDAAQRENSELTARVGDLEDQIATMERLIQVTNQEMRALQLAAGQTPDEPEQSGAEEAAAPAETPAESPVVVPQPEPAKPSTVVRSAPQPEPGIVDLILDNILYLALAVVALLGGLLFWKRRSEQAAEEDQDLFAEAQEEELPADDDFEQEMTFDDELEGGADDSEPEDVEVAEAETADVAGEADIYIAYGKYDQAEDMLLKALDREPGRTDVTLKLLEVYAETQNMAQFDQHYANLLAGNDKAAQQRAEELRESIPGAGDFDRTQVQSLAAESDEDMDALLSLDLDEPAETQSFDQLEGLDGLEENFDLADEGGLSLDLDTSAQDTAASADDLDFSLDDLDDKRDSAAEDDGFALDLDDDTLGASDDAFSLDLDDEQTDLTAADTGADDDFSLSLDDALADSGEEEDDFSLDLGDLEADASATAEPDDFALDLGDLEAETPAADDFSLALDDELTAEADDFELSLDEPADHKADTAAPAADDDFDLALDDELALDDAGTDTLSVEADDFDSEASLGDMDLAALDKEMDSMSADLDLDSDLADLDADAATAEQEPEFDISADLGIEEGADELPPMNDDSVFDEAMAGQAADEDEDAELGFLADSDEVATKLDLARAYIDMGDSEGARDILSEVMEEGDDKQKGEAGELLSRIS